ncbi:hypothetical protein niasHT_009669 [Heterodera trifolii]|uniref:DNA-directed DNA polymerase n=1 Tax=Heterodera trifolii TaxID=157864 RepID=A0ABD2M120_9BILA
MRNTLSNTEIVGSMERWMELWRDNTIEFGRPVKISEELSRVVYRKKEAFIKEHKVSNIVLSLWTTSAARIKLYEYMEQVNKEEGSKLLYCDTDSLAFAHRKGREMTREYADSEILEYVSAGPKQYALKLRRKKDGVVWHIRGMTLDRRNDFKYELFKEMVLDYKKGCPENEDPEKMFKKILKKLMVDAMNREPEPGWKIEKISVDLYCSALSDPVIIPARPFQHSNPDSVFNEFMHRQQSFGEVNLLDQRISIIIATYSFPVQ